MNKKSKIIKKTSRQASSHNFFFLHLQGYSLVKLGPSREIFPSTVLHHPVKKNKNHTFTPVEGRKQEPKQAVNKWEHQVNVCAPHWSAGYTHLYFFFFCSSSYYFRNTVSESLKGTVSTRLCVQHVLTGNKI